MAELAASARLLEVSCWEGSAAGDKPGLSVGRVFVGPALDRCLFRVITLADRQVQQFCLIGIPAGPVVIDQAC